MGLYAYRRDFLLHLAQPPDPSGTGRATRAVTRPGARLPDTGGPDDLRDVGVDTPEDVARAERLLAHAAR